LWAWLQREPLQRCLALGNVVGALSVAHFGDSQGYPYREELEAWRQGQQVER
jgi:sugar/nucleoside kinase (ribokinase family)